MNKMTPYEALKLVASEFERFELPVTNFKTGTIDGIIQQLDTLIDGKVLVGIIYYNCQPTKDAPRCKSVILDTKMLAIDFENVLRD